MYSLLVNQILGFGKQTGAGRDVWLWLKPSQLYLPFAKACDRTSLLTFVLVKKQKEAEASLTVWMTAKHRGHKNLVLAKETSCVTLLEELIPCAHGGIMLDKSSKGFCQVLNFSFFSRTVAATEVSFLFRNFGSTYTGVIKHPGCKIDNI